VNVNDNRAIDFWGAWEAFGHNAAVYAGKTIVVLPFFISTASSTETASGSLFNATARHVPYWQADGCLFGADYQLGMGGRAHALFNDQG
jgi:hypothetical protein